MRVRQARKLSKLPCIDNGSDGDDDDDDDDDSDGDDDDDDDGDDDVMIMVVIMLIVTMLMAMDTLTKDFTDQILRMKAIQKFGQFLRIG